MAKATPNRGKQATLSVDELASQATEKTNDFLPIADFGPKTTSGKWRVTFLEAKPRVVEKEFEDGQRLGINVRMAPILAGGELGTEEEVCIFMRPESKNGKLHSLTNGILALYNASDKDLRDVVATIRKRVYEHDRFGETCAYDVVRVHE